MKLLLLKCYVCDFWYSPRAHRGHCPTCATLAEPINGRRYAWNTAGTKIHEIRRVLPKLSVNALRERSMAQVLYKASRYGRADIKPAHREQ